MDLFQHVTPVDSGLFYQRHDANDRRLGEVVPQMTYEAADIVLLGLPQDIGVERNKGRLGAKDAPDAIRRAFYRLVEFPSPTPRVFDLGNTRVDYGSLEEIHENHQAIVRQILQDGKRVIVLGGGNDTSYPDCSAVALESEHLLAFNIDAHFDVRADDICNSGTPYRQLLEEGYVKPETFYEIGYQRFANSPAYVDYLVEKGVTFYSADHVYERGIDTLFHTIIEAHHQADAIFWGLDMDVVRAADAPGVSAINPVGLTGRQFIQIAELAGRQKQTRLFEITEVNPVYDIDDRTSRLAAAAIYAFLQGTVLYLNK